MNAHCSVSTLFRETLSLMAKQEGGANVIHEFYNSNRPLEDATVLNGARISLNHRRGKTGPLSYFLRQFIVSSHSFNSSPFSYYSCFFHPHSLRLWPSPEGTQGYIMILFLRFCSILPCRSSHLSLLIVVSNWNDLLGSLLHLTSPILCTVLACFTTKITTFLHLSTYCFSTFASASHFPSLTRAIKR